MVVDLFGVAWLMRRAVRYRVVDEGPSPAEAPHALRFARRAPGLGREVA